MNENPNPESEEAIIEFTAKSKRKFPLRTVLLVPFLLQIILISSLVGYVSYRNGEKTVNEVAGRLSSEINDRINEYLKDFVMTPVEIIQNNANAINLGRLSYNNQSELEHYFYEQIQIYKSVSSIYFGNAAGGLANSGREAVTGTLCRIGTDNFKSGILRKYSTTLNGDRANLMLEVPDFDARLRPWYKAALLKGDVAWSDVYILFTGQDMAISVSKPVYGSGRKLLGVLSVDLFLSHISSFLAGIDVGKTGVSFIVDSKGLLIASSSDETIITPKKTGKAQRRIEAVESSELLVRSASMRIMKEFGKFSDISSDRHLEFFLDGSRKFMHVSPMLNRYGLEWIIVTVIPESDFMENIKANNRITVFIIISAVFISFIIGYFTSLKIAEPVAGLKSFAKNLSEGEWPEDSGESGIEEIDDLKESFFYMSGKLKELIENLKIEIKERMLTEGALRESEEKYRELIQYSNSIILRVDNRGRITYANDYALNFFGYTHEELLWKNAVGTIVPVTDSAGRNLEDMVKGIVTTPEKYERNENENMRKDGSPVWVIWSNRGIKDENGVCVEVLCIGNDITERRAAELEKIKLLKEKDIILHEVHHRIKNNMNTIAGLLYLQSVSMDNESAASALREAHSRVLSMMMIYDKLFRSSDFNSISTADYFPELINGIVMALPEFSRIKIETMIDDYTLDSNSLVPIGIIINELMTNTCKYAFPGRENGRIDISFTKGGEDSFELVYKDNGIGIPESIVLGESSGFGLNLVYLLAQQMRGNVEIVRGEGTVFKVKLFV